MDCFFCKIAAGEVASDIVYEDDDILAFNDIAPQAPVHLLVIPKKHIDSSAAITPENSALVARAYEVIAHLARERGLDKGFRVVTNTGEEGGQSVGHLHFHVLAGRQMAWPPG